LFLFASIVEAQTEKQSVNRAGHYIYTHSDTVTADNTQVFELYSKISDAAELVSGVSVTRVSGTVNLTCIRAYSFDGALYNNLDTVTYSTDASGLFVFDNIDLDYPYYKYTLDGTGTQVIYPIKFHNIIREK